MLHRFTAPWLNGSNYALDWNGPVERPFRPLGEVDRALPISALFEAAAGTHATRVALDDGVRRLTYDEALQHVRRLASVVAAETRSDELIGILLPASVDFSIAMLACLAAGRVFVPLDAHYPVQWIADVISDSAVAAVVGRFDEPGTASLVPETVRRISISSPARTDVVPRPVGPDEPAFVIFTSGSTGRPKGIVNSQRNLLQRVAQYVAAAHIAEDDRFLPLSSECTIAGLRERLTALLCGATLHLIDVQRASARMILDCLRESRISIVYAVPALLRTLIQLGDARAPASLRIVRVGGEAVLWSDVEQLRSWLPSNCLIEVGYSSTEAPIMQWFVPRDFPREGSRVPLGYPLAGNALAIVGEDGQAVAPGEEGELIIRSPYVALGCWTGGRCATGDFVSDPNDRSCRILQTGDLVRLRSDGLIELVGRKDRQIKIRGQRIEPAELEAALRLQSGVRDAAVFPRQVGKSWWLIAYVVPSQKSVDLLANLKQTLRQILPASLQPRRIHAIDAIPRLASAKLDMKRLAERDAEFQRQEAQVPLSSSGAAPCGSTETRMAEIWQRVLGLDEIGRDADFFDLGGDSLMTLDLMFAIEEQFGVDMPVTMIFEAPTIAALAAAIDAPVTPEFSPLVLMRKSGDGPPLFIVHGVGGNVMELFPIGRQIVSRGPVYAIQARGLDGREAPNCSIAGMADDYLSAIRKEFPSGPYHLAGYSSGGLVAFEMARRLEALGTPPASLTLIDSQTNARQWPLAVWLGHLRQRAVHHAVSMAKQSWRENLGYAARVGGSLIRGMAWRMGVGEAPQRKLGMQVPSALQAVYDATLAAIAGYRPARFGGETTLIMPQTRDELMAPVDRVWRRQVAALHVCTVPGDHRSMIQPEGAGNIALVLSDIAGRIPPSDGRA